MRCNCSWLGACQSFTTQRPALVEPSRTIRRSTFNRCLNSLIYLTFSMTAGIVLLKSPERRNGWGLLSQGEALSYGGNAVSGVGRRLLYC